MNKRKSAVAGMFYPESCAEIQRYIEHFNQAATKPTFDVSPKALIVPHAGYIYSGYTANLAYRYAALKCPDIKRVVVSVLVIASTLPVLPSRCTRRITRHAASWKSTLRTLIRSKKSLLF